VIIHRPFTVHVVSQCIDASLAVNVVCPCVSARHQRSFLTMFRALAVLALTPH